MTKIKLPKHIHLYRRVDLVPKWKVKRGAEPYLVFECQVPTCSHWIPIARALNKICECNRCHRPMVIDKITIQLEKPHCQECIVKKSVPDMDKLKNLLENI